MARQERLADLMCLSQWEIRRRLEIAMPLHKHKDDTCFLLSRTFSVPAKTPLLKTPNPLQQVDPNTAVLHLTDPATSSPTRLDKQAKQVHAPHPDHHHTQIVACKSPVAL
jgi:hypothetical protein